MHACEIRALEVAYHTGTVLSDATLDVPSGIVLGIVGPNGAGKSTLIRGALGLVKPVAGEIRFFGEPLRRVRNRIGYMPQSTAVDWDFPTTVFDVVLMGTYGDLGWIKRAGKVERQRVVAALEQTGMSEFADRQIGELSGGQRQRVFLARALAQEPDLYFMDEPFQGVDAKSQQAIVDVLHVLREQGKTIVMVHHDLTTVREYCDSVALVNGTVIASGPTDVTFTVENIRKTYDAGSANDAFLAGIS
ncbi:MAG: metal ABC transporter ATP-binding protein [Gulosibacter sp.]|uniref:metal ABC transporter ATP-binding protein n=1 Tax=Gulosibacter sp. TaxID=2817531 RepID=UPI003F910600